MAIAVLGQRLPLDVLHDEVRTPVRRRAAVEQPRDVRMIERRDDLSLGPEAPDEILAVHAALHQLQRDPLAVRVVGAHGQKDRAHAAASDLLQDLVRADLGADVVVASVLSRGAVGHCAAHGALTLRVGMAFEQLPDVAKQLRVVSTGARDKRNARVFGQRDGFGKDVLDPRPALRIHGRPSRSRVNNHAFAVVHSRPTVASEI